MTHVIRTYDATGTCDDGVCVYDTASDGACTNCCYGAEINPTGDPIGGGVGYSRTVGLEEATYHISSDAADPSEAFLSFLNDLQTGDTLFIDGDVIIDLTGEEIIYIGSNVDNVTIASDRGVDGSLGALIYTTTYDTRPLFRSSGDGLRLTGLRTRSRSWAIIITTPLQISSLKGFVSPKLAGRYCDIWGFVMPAYFVDGALGGYVTIITYHTQRAGSVIVSPSTSDVLIEANRFNNGRHHIASRSPRPSYEAVIILFWRMPTATSTCTVRGTTKSTTKRRFTGLMTTHFCTLRTLLSLTIMIVTSAS